MRVPEYILRNMGVHTSRQFKSIKRRQIREVLKAFKVYEQGCVCCPGYGDGTIDQIRRLLEDIQKKQSVREWG